MRGKMEAKIEADPATHRTPLQMDKTWLKSFLGKCNVYGRFIENLVGRARHLTSMLEKGRNRMGDTEQTIALGPSYTSNKPWSTAISSNRQILSLRKKARPFMIYMDALQYSMGVPCSR